MAYPLPTSGPITVREPVRVAVDFLPVGKHAGSQRVRPLAFFWSGRKYVIKQINLVYRKRVGDHYHWCFAVSDESNSFVLLYDPDEMKWSLEEVYEL